MDRDTLILALTAFAEARGEGGVGIRAQVHSVVNRHATGRWFSGKTLGGTCLYPFAYSAWNTDDPNRRAAVEIDPDDFTFQLCLSEAADAIAGTTDDPTVGATHYYADGTPEPNWVSGMKDGQQVAPAATFCCKIGRHLFYKDVA